MIKQSGRKIGLRFGINDWVKHLHRSILKRMNSKIVRQKMKKFEWYGVLKMLFVSKKEYIDYIVMMFLLLSFRNQSISEQERNNININYVPILWEEYLRIKDYESQ